MLGDLVIVEVNAADEADLIALWERAGVTRPWNDPVRDIAFARKGAHSTILVAREHGNLIASAMVGEDGHRGWVYYVAVEPERQNAGLGRAIMQAAEKWLADRGIWKVQLLVRADNAVVKEFYERLGYRDTRTTCLQKVIEPRPAARQEPAE